MPEDGAETEGENEVCFDGSNHPLFRDRAVAAALVFHVAPDFSRIGD